MFDKPLQRLVVRGVVQRKGTAKIRWEACLEVFRDGASTDDLGRQWDGDVQRRIEQI
jgi:hypothetical protein